MQVDVDWALCQNHGQCAIAAPNVFSLNNNGELQFDPTHVSEHPDDVAEAADVCPTQAIFIND
jgi:ferredoxin